MSLEEVGGDNKRWGAIGQQCPALRRNGYHAAEGDALSGEVAGVLAADFFASSMAVSIDACRL